MVYLDANKETGPEMVDFKSLFSSEFIDRIEKFKKLQSKIQKIKV